MKNKTDKKDKHNKKDEAETNKSARPPNKNNTKRLIIILVSCVGLMVVLILLNNINFSADISGWFGGRKEETVIKPYLERPDYKINIYENELYMAKNLNINYSDGFASSMISETINEYGKIGEFFLGYFKTIREGDAVKYNSYFTDIYYEDEDNKEYKRFTMQMLYDAEVELISDTLIESGEYKGITRYLFKVSYKIMQNNGTFRDDMPSDTMVPVLMEILSDENGMKINSITKNKTVI